MYCTHCGKEIEDDAKFCPYCKKELTASGGTDTKEMLKKTADAVMNSAKVIGNSVNEATNGKAQVYAEKAKETAKEFKDDVKQVAKDKDTSNFFTKNKYRNVKIFAVLFVAVFLVSAILGGESKEEKMAKNIVSASMPDAKIKSVTKVVENDGAEMNIYVVKFIPSGEEEHSAWVCITSGSHVSIDGVYSKNNYDKLNKKIDAWKEMSEMNSK